MTTKEQAEVRRYGGFGIAMLHESPTREYVLASDYDALKAENDALAASEQRLAEALEECAEHFKTLREAGVHVWPNHPLNPERRIAEALAARKGEA